MTLQVYLIHIDQPVGHARTDAERAERNLPPRTPGWRSTAQHYIGYAKDLPHRLREHQTGQGSSLLHYATRTGINWRVVRTWKGGYQLEHDLKRRHNAPALCPVCNPRTWKRQAAEKTKKEGTE